VDATLIAAPPSTKNKHGKRDPEMHQSKKGNDWHFGMKAHVGVDAASGLLHTVIGPAGNVSDVTQAGSLLHGDESAALGDAGCQGVEKRAENLGKSVTLARGDEALQAQGAAQEQARPHARKTGASQGERAGES
jgi:IS5 family transposase